MTRKYLCILMIFLLALMVAACSQPEPEPEESAPTLPTIREEWTPRQLLQDAIDKTRAQGRYVLRYGTITTRDGGTDEVAQSQTVTPDAPLNLETVYDYLPQLPDRVDFLDAFCNQPLRAVPSNTGTIRYLVPNLTWEDAAGLMYSKPVESGYENPLCQLALEVDAFGRLSHFEFVVDGGEEQLTYFITLTFPEDT